MKDLVYNDFGAVTKGFIHSGPTRFVSLSNRFSGTPNPAYFQLFNKAGEPAPGDVPLIVMVFASGLAQTLPIPIPEGVPFALGLGFAWSSTLATFTDGCVLTAPHITTVFYRV